MTTDATRQEGTLIVKDAQTRKETDDGHGTVTTSARQFDFARNWRNKIVPLLDDPSVVHALTFGMKLYDPAYRKGDTPWGFGRGPLNGQRARRGCLSWYQPWGRCHHIAPFSWALGKKLYPYREWELISSDIHTVVIGYLDDWEQPEWVMDILLFREKTAQESLDFAKLKKWRFYPSLAKNAASICDDPESAFEVYCEHFAS
jgi:hypothetical protein